MVSTSNDRPGFVSHVTNLIMLIEDDIDHAELIIRTILLSEATLFSWALVDPTIEINITRVNRITMDFLIRSLWFIFLLLYEYFNQIFKLLAIETPDGYRDE